MSFFFLLSVCYKANEQIKHRLMHHQNPSFGHCTNLMHHIGATAAVDNHEPLS